MGQTSSLEFNNYHERSDWCPAMRNLKIMKMLLSFMSSTWTMPLWSFHKCKALDFFNFFIRLCNYYWRSESLVNIDLLLIPSWSTRWKSSSKVFLLKERIVALTGLWRCPDTWLPSAPPGRLCKWGRWAHRTVETFSSLTHDRLPCLPPPGAARSSTPASQSSASRRPSSACCWSRTPPSSPPATLERH